LVIPTGTKGLMVYNARATPCPPHSQSREDKGTTKLWRNRTVVEAHARTLPQPSPWRRSAAAHARAVAVAIVHPRQHRRPHSNVHGEEKRHHASPPGITHAVAVATNAHTVAVAGPSVR
jgi:hypothetical protein